MNGPTTASINGEIVPLGPRETLLEAALRHGLDFPNGCRVGGCGACKCRLLEGRVHELTETAYLLSADEIEGGYILACQSVARSNVRVAVDLTTKSPTRRVSGRIIAQKKVTHDIVHLSAQLDEPLVYRAGQFARVRLDLVPGIERCYSFAAPPRSDGVVEFYVRRVAGGQLSSIVNDRSVVGARLDVEGPLGDFWLRPGDAPILMAAGGSGLSPLLAMLEEAAAAGVSRSVTLLFGAREERDLYALASIEALARRWRGKFRFVPVLSAEAPGSRWSGARGLLSEHVPSLVESGTEAYLCGPPGMVDAVAQTLLARGVPSARIHCDRFVTRAEAGSAAEADPARVLGDRSLAPVAGPLDYLKYSIFHGIGLTAVAGILAGGTVVTLTLLVVLGIYLLGDIVAGDDTTAPRFRHPGILTAQLWLALPLVSLIVFVSVWTVCPGDPLGFGGWITGWTGYDALSARAATTWAQHLAAVLATGLMIGMIGTIPAHELTHRTWDRVSMVVGRWLLAFSLDTSFAIEHVYGHHRYVATHEDPATAPRGRSVYLHMLVSTIRGNRSAWRIEVARLAKRKRGRFSWHNVFLRGQLMSAALLVAAYAMGGMTAVAYFAACALLGKSLLEVVNYIEHYGMLRRRDAPVEPRHSWNTNRRVSSWTMFNLTRHSHHHAQGEVPYHDLRAYPEAPRMIGGYLATLVVALIPPLWHRLMTPKLRAWDRDHADADERELAREANARSGIRALEAVRSSLGAVRAESSSN